MKNKFLIFILFSLIPFSGCTTYRAPAVERISPEQVTDLSGRWNDTDSRLTAEAMITQLFGGRWLLNFERANNRQPVVIVGLINNKSHEHISAETFIKDLERAIVNQGSVRLIQAAQQREELRLERGDQQDFSSPETMKKWGRELGADFMLQGDINSIVDQIQRKQTTTYQIDLELSNLETNEIIWMGDKKIKKVISN